MPRWLLSMFRNAVAPRTRVPSRLAARRRLPGRLGKPAQFAPAAEVLEDRTLLSVFAVTNTNDSGPGSLRQAILDANADTTGILVTIIFQADLADSNHADVDAHLPGGDPDPDVWIINPASTLPALNNPAAGIVIDGRTQTSFTGDLNPFGPEVVLDMTGNPLSPALLLQSAGNQVHGLNIQGYGISPALGTTPGVRVTGDGNWLSGNFIGTDATGRQSGVVAGSTGVRLEAGASDNLIGSKFDGVNDEAERNLISGNGSVGVFLTGLGTDRNTIAGNFVGTDADGTAALANGEIGVAFVDGPDSNIVEQNVISGNGLHGVALQGSGTARNTIVANFIGTDATGMTAIPNRQVGVSITQGANANLVEQNLLSGNGLHGVGLLHSGTDANTIIGNYIGTDASGMAALPNSQAGIVMQSGPESNVVEQNVISGNRLQGVFLTGPGTDHNTISRNRIGTSVDGSTAIPNIWQGVWPRQGPDGNSIDGNLVSGNGAVGVYLTGSNENSITGNLIGTDITGIQAIPNGTIFPGGSPGILVEFGSSHNQIGTNGDGVNDEQERNVISGNGNVGLIIQHQSPGVPDLIPNTPTAENVVAGNYIGTDITGTRAIPNAIAGVVLQHGATSNLIGTNGDGLADEAERNVISGNLSHGVAIHGPVVSALSIVDDMVAGNLIGTNADGTAALPNAGNGVHIFGGAAFNRIGTDGNRVSDSLERNVLSGNAGNGVLISDPGSANSVIAGNFIGTDGSGDLAVPNQLSGVVLLNGASSNEIGTNGDGLGDDAEGNIISGNRLTGVAVFHSGTVDNRISGNHIGVNAAGTAHLANGGFGVDILEGASFNLVGTDGDEVSDRDERNVISGNIGDGVRLTNGAHENTVAGNYIGTDATGELDRGNGNAGVSIVDAAANTIGGDTIVESNIIAFNADAGVLVAGATATENTIRLNSIHSNGGSGISLAGGNGQQEAPTLLLAESGGAETRVVGTLQSKPDATFTLDFYIDTAPDSAGEGGGQQFIVSIGVTSDGTGRASFDVTLTVTLAANQGLSATATDAAGNTSEFSVALRPDGTSPTSTVDPLPPRTDSLVFPVSVSGSDPVVPGEVSSGVSHYDVFVSIDGGPFMFWQQLPADAPSADFVAESNHTYGFRSVAVDAAGNVENKPETVDASIIVGVLEVTGFDVQRGSTQRSFIQYLDVSFNEDSDAELAAIIDSLADQDPSNDRVRLRRFGLDGEGSGELVALTPSMMTIAGQTLQIDFGLQGIGGNRNSSRGDGYYVLEFDLNGSTGDGYEEGLRFFRLFGDANGDRRVHWTDLVFIAFTLFQSDCHADGDVNGDGDVNLFDVFFASRQLGRALDGDLKLDD